MRCSIEDATTVSSKRETETESQTRRDPKMQQDGSGFWVSGTCQLSLADRRTCLLSGRAVHPCAPSTASRSRQATDGL